MDETDVRPPDGHGPWTVWSRQTAALPLRCQGQFSDYDKAVDVADQLVTAMGCFEAVVKDANLDAAYSHRGRRQA